MRLRWWCAGGIVASVSGLDAESQVPRDSYYLTVPPSSRIVAQTGASARLHLYGDRADPQYRDEAPVDGIDDARAARLMRMAERFSPILRRNNFSVPRDWRQAMGKQVFLQVDTWVNGKLARADSIDLARPASAAVDVRGDSAAGDSALAALLHATDPRRSLSAIASPTHEQEQILYLDFPGHDDRRGDRRTSTTTPGTPGSTPTSSSTKGTDRTRTPGSCSSSNTGSSIHSTTGRTTTRATGSI